MSLIWLNLQQHDKVSRDHSKNKSGVAMVSQRDLSMCMCVYLHECVYACGVECVCVGGWGLGGSTEN